MLEHAQPIQSSGFNHALCARDSATDKQHLTQRIEEFALRDRTDKPINIRPSSPAPKFHLHLGIPEVSADQLDAEILRHAIFSHGVLLVRNLAPKSVMEELRKTVDQVLQSCEQASAHSYQTRDASPYFDPPDVLRKMMPEPDLGYARAFHRNSGSAMCVEAPSVCEELIALYQKLGLYPLLRDFFKEAPCLSAQKWVLRRSVLPISEAGWHQDGAFMGTDINSLNLWLPLTLCGGSSGAPGLDVVPKRLESIVSSEGAEYDWSVADAKVKESFRDTPPVSPVFEAGDALFFDHLCLHRTQYAADFPAQRYALETWFFGSSCFPRNQVPLAW